MSAMSTKKQLTLFVTFYVDPAKIEDWKKAHRPVWASCAQEPECLLFDVFQDPSVPGKMRLVEVWSEDRDWFEKKQLAKPYYKTLWEKSRPTWTKEMEIEYFERLGEGSSFRHAYFDGGRSMD